MAKILVAEDERMMLKSLSFKLSKEGHDVDTAENGKDAWELVQRTKYDLVLADIIMPYVTGLELLERIKNNPATKDIKVIMLSALGQEDTVVQAFDIGADDFMTKPFSPNELLVRIKKLIR